MFVVLISIFGLLSTIFANSSIAI